MAVDEWNFRVNCSNYKGSFWVEDFLESADKAKLLIPDDLIGKRIVWKKASRSWDIKGREVTYSNYVIDRVMSSGARVVTPQVIAEAAPVQQTSPDVPAEDPMEVAVGLAVGKTETQFRSAASLHQVFIANPAILSLARAGAITKALVDEGKLVLVGEGAKAVYQKA